MQYLSALAVELLQSYAKPSIKFTRKSPKCFFEHDFFQQDIVIIVINELS